MADEHKKSENQDRRASRRGVLKRGERRPSEKPQAGSQRGGGSNQQPKKDEAAASTEKVSTLLETTSKEVKQLLEAADDAAEKIREAAKTETSINADGEAANASEGSSVLASLNKEVKQVLEAADDAGEKIREEAREEARRLIEETRRRAEAVTTEHIDRVSQMSGELLEQLGAVDEQMQNLRSAFDQSIRAMGADLGVEDTAVWDTQNGAVEEEHEGELRQRLGRRRKMVPARVPEGISEGARLLAMQQLTAGVAPEEIEERLRKELGVENPKPLLEWMGIDVQASRESSRRSGKD